MLHVIVPIITPRIDYIFKLIFNELLSVEYTINIEKETTIYHKKSILIYGYQPFEQHLFIQSIALLFENEIKPQELNITHFKNYPTLFMHRNKNAALPYDIFAAVFYLVSRYEEYLSEQKDEHGRFEYKNSLAYQYDFIHLPIVNIWVNQLKEVLQQQYPNLVFKSSSYQFVPTFDIDYAWAYLNKGWWRTLGAIGKELIQFNIKTLKDRLQVHFSLKKDHYFTFEQIYQLHSAYNLSPIFFFLVGEYGQYDKNISIHNKSFQALIQKVSEQYTVNIHPSYQSNQHVDIVQKEKTDLEKVIQKPITASRQHFLKMTLPRTYRNLIQLGITHDYTMGYAETIGFRAGIANAFLWYDLEKEIMTNLRIVPFQVMDVTLNVYQQYSPEEAIHAVQKIIQEIQAVNGTFSTLWHNNSLCEQGIWKGWTNVYKEILKEGTRYKV